MATIAQGGWILKQRANIKNWRRYWAQVSVVGSKVSLVFAASNEAGVRGNFEKETDVTGYVMRRDLSKAGWV
jgi:hypothetical protein